MTKQLLFTANIRNTTETNLLLQGALPMCLYI